MWVNFKNRSGSKPSAEGINRTIKTLSKNVYYVISGIASTGVTFYYRKESCPKYTPSYKYCWKYQDVETAKKEAMELKNSNGEFFRIIDPTTLCVLEIAEDVIVTKTVRM